MNIEPSFHEVDHNTRDGFIEQGIEIANLLPEGAERDQFTAQLAKQWILKSTFRYIVTPIPSDK